jgi:hypothetical protein
LPGTRIWDELKNKDLVSDEMDFSAMSQAAASSRIIDGMSPEEFTELALFMAREFDKHNAAKGRNA